MKHRKVIGREFDWPQFPAIRERPHPDFVAAGSA
jgi:hypothetical protein